MATREEEQEDQRRGFELQQEAHDALGLVVVGLMTKDGPMLIGDADGATIPLVVGDYLFVTRDTAEARIEWAAREHPTPRLAHVHLFNWRTGLPKDGQRGELAIDSGTQQMYVCDWVPIAGIEA